jgi:hypothetical protein
MERCSVFFFESTAMATDFVPGAVHSAKAAQAPNPERSAVTR